MYFSEQKIHTFLSLPGYLSITEGKNEDLHTYYTISEPSVVFITIYVLSKPSFSHLAYFHIITIFKDRFLVILFLSTGYLTTEWTFHMHWCAKGMNVT